MTTENTATESPQERLKSIISIAQSGNLQDSSQQLESLLSEHPKFVRGWVELGRTYRRMGDHTQALQAFQQAEKLSPNHPTIPIDCAIELRELNQYEAAEQKLQEILETQPDSLLAQHNLGRLYKKQQKTKQAIACYQRAITINPKHLPTHLQLVATWRELAQYEQAQQQLESAQLHHPQNVRVLTNMATLAREQQLVERALSYCEQACQAAPQQLEPPLYLAETLRVFNRLEAATTHLTALLAQYPNNPKVFLQLGHLERQKGQRQLALEWFQQAHKHAENPAQALSAQLFVLEELRFLNHLDNALSLANEILQQHPENVRANMIQAGILQTQLKLEAAEAQYKSITEAAPHNIHAHLQFADLLSETYRLPEAMSLLECCYQKGHRELPLLMKLGQLAKAEEDWAQAHHWLEQARQQHPYKPQVYGALADVLYIKGDVSAAMALLAEACDRLPNTPDIPLRLANLKLRFGYPAESLDILQAAYKKFPTHVPTALQLARIHFQQGDFSQASAILTTITSDHGPWLKQIERLWGDMALWQFDLQKAIQHFQQVLNIPPTTSQEHQRLALTLMLTGNIEQAHAQLTKATEILHAQKTSGKGGYPIKSHVAFLINQMRNNPQLCGALVRSQSVSPDGTQTEPKRERLPILAAIIAQEPNYLGGSTFLCKELRQQGIFAELRHSFSNSATTDTINHEKGFEKEAHSIPKRIVQYWDNPSPPNDIIEVGISWQTHNPDYQYARFSFNNAVKFIKHHYDSDVLQAFQYCDQSATQADFFRLAYLNKMGGFYADADDRCRRSLESLRSSNAELIVYQEENACIGNNFIGCTPGQPIIRAALYQAVANLLCYNNESPWLKTGPGLLTTMVCSGLLPYLSLLDYRTWPRLCILNQEELRTYVWWPVSLPYKHTAKSWQKVAYHSRK